MSNVSIREVRNLMNMYAINKHAYPVKYLKLGMDIEMEHWKTANHEIDTIFRIVLDHIREYPDYYESLVEMEKNLRIKWHLRNKPKLFIN